MSYARQVCLFVVVGTLMFCSASMRPVAGEEKNAGVQGDKNDISASRGVLAVEVASGVPVAIPQALLQSYPFTPELPDERDAWEPPFHKIARQFKISPSLVEVLSDKPVYPLKGYVARVVQGPFWLSYHPEASVLLLRLDAFVCATVPVKEVFIPDPPSPAPLGFHRYEREDFDLSGEWRISFAPGELMPEPFPLEFHAYRPNKVLYHLIIIEAQSESALHLPGCLYLVVEDHWNRLLTATLLGEGESFLRIAGISDDEAPIPLEKAATSTAEQP